MGIRSWLMDHRTRPKGDHTHRPHSELHTQTEENHIEHSFRGSKKVPNPGRGKVFDLPTTCWMITLIVLKGISPHGTLFVARARHSLGGTDCKKCSMAGKSSTGSNFVSLRSCGMFRANFQIHFSTNSATLASSAPGSVPLLGNGFTICNRRAKRALYRINSGYIQSLSRKSSELT